MWSHLQWQEKKRKWLFWCFLLNKPNIWWRQNDLFNVFHEVYKSRCKCSEVTSDWAYLKKPYFRQQVLGNFWKTVHFKVFAVRHSESLVTWKSCVERKLILVSSCLTKFLFHADLNINELKDMVYSQWHTREWVISMLHPMFIYFHCLLCIAWHLQLISHTALWMLTLS